MFRFHANQFATIYRGTPSIGKDPNIVSIFGEHPISDRKAVEGTVDETELGDKTVSDKTESPFWSPGGFFGFQWVSMGLKRPFYTNKR